MRYCRFPNGIGDMTKMKYIHFMIFKVLFDKFKIFFKKHKHLKMDSILFALSPCKLQRCIIPILNLLTYRFDFSKLIIALGLKTLWL